MSPAQQPDRPDELAETLSPSPTEPMTSPCSGSDHDCDDAVAQLYTFLDGELDDQTLVKVEAHLRHCAPCLEAFDFEAELRKVVAAKCREQAPAELKVRILTVLQQLEASPGAPS